MESSEKTFLNNKTKRSNSLSKESNKSDSPDNYVFSNKSNSAYIPRDFFKFNYCSETGNFIFSNNFVDEEKEEENIFKNIHM